jgi:hypothetical protein
MAPPALSSPRVRRLLFGGFTRPGDRLSLAPTSVAAEPCRYVGRQVVETLNRRCAAWCGSSSATGWPSSSRGADRAAASQPAGSIAESRRRPPRAPRLPPLNVPKGSPASPFSQGDGDRETPGRSRPPDQQLRVRRNIGSTPHRPQSSGRAVNRLARHGRRATPLTHGGRSRWDSRVTTETLPSCVSRAR